jgi:hypothetical protein
MKQRPHYTALTGRECFFVYSLPSLLGWAVLFWPVGPNETNRSETGHTPQNTMKHGGPFILFRASFYSATLSVKPEARRLRLRYLAISGRNKETVHFPPSLLGWAMVFWPVGPNETNRSETGHTQQNTMKHGGPFTLFRASFYSATLSVKPEAQRLRLRYISLTGRECFFVYSLPSLLGWAVLFWPVGPNETNRRGTGQTRGFAPTTDLQQGRVLNPPLRFGGDRPPPRS